MNYGMSRLWAAHMAVERFFERCALAIALCRAAIRVLQVERKRHGAAPRRLLPHRTLLEPGTWIGGDNPGNSKGVSLRCIAFY